MLKLGGTIYALGAEGIAWVKIGSTRMAATRRLQELQIGQPFPLTLLATVPVDDNLQRIERQVHAFLAEERRRGEWFEIALDGDALAALVVRAVQCVQAEDAGQIPRDTKHAPLGLGLGPAIVKARAGLGWQQQHLATLTGISQKYLSRIENDKADPGWGVLQRLLVVIDLDLQAIARANQPVAP